MDKDKEDKLLQLIQACWRYNVDPLIVLQWKRFGEQKHKMPRVKVLRELITLWGKGEVSRLTGYSPRNLRTLMKTT